MFYNLLFKILLYIKYIVLKLKIVNFESIILDI